MSSQAAVSPPAFLRDVDYDAARWTHGFWAERFELCRTVMLASMEQALRQTNNAACLDNFLIAAGGKDGKPCGANWGDGDCYKWLEAVAHVYGVTRDVALDRKMDEWIAIIAKAQAPDGYISTNIQLNPKKERLKVRAEHEDYNMGHLMTAACVHHRVTGKDNFLRVARRAADYLYGVFHSKPRDLVHFGWNPSHLMGLVDLYRATGDRRYLELSDIFLTFRGSAPGDFYKVPGYFPHSGGDQNQDRVPLRRETKAVGHSVTATYLYCGAADLYAETGEKALFGALDRIWNDMVGRKIYITGGIAPLHNGVSIRGDPVHEAFGRSYELPNATAYNETCASVGNAMWNWRMLRLTGDAKYADLMENILYNSLLSAMSLDGKRFFYTNPLRWHGHEHPLMSNDAAERWSTWKCYCCPPQVARALAWLHQWAYSVSDDALWVHLYGGSRLDTKLPDGSTLKLAQETHYPWSGCVGFKVETAPSKPLALMFRIPSWASGAKVHVNGKRADAEPKAGAYLSLRREWRSGDKVGLVLPMKPRLIEANPRAEEVRNHLAVARGPIVYCMESLDLPAGVKLLEVRLPRRMQLATTRGKDKLDGVVIVQGVATRISQPDWNQRLYRDFAPGKAERLPVTFIPYYAWANRGIAEMSVWLPAE